MLLHGRPRLETRPLSALRRADFHMSRVCANVQALVYALVCQRD